jgi:hypothetical protein
MTELEKVTKQCSVLVMLLNSVVAETCEEVDAETAYESGAYHRVGSRYWLLPLGGLKQKLND